MGIGAGGLGGADWVVWVVGGAGNRCRMGNLAIEERLW